MAAQLLGDLFLNGITGAPSGSVRFYQPQTLVPITVWSNDGATQAITQPVPLDANGKSVVPIYLTVPARMIVYSSSGAQLMDVERVDGTRAETAILANTLWPTTTSLNGLATAIATSLGGTDGLAKVSGSGSIARSAQAKFSESLSVKDFNAKGDGTTDDTTALIAAIAAMSSGGTLNIPAGTYLVAQTLTISTANITLRGDGQTASIIKNTSATGDCLTISNIAGTTIEGVGIANSATSTGSGIVCTGNSLDSVLLSRVQIAGHRFGITIPSGGVATIGGSGLTLREVNITCDDNAASVCLNILTANISGAVSIYGGRFSTGGAGSNGICVLAGSATANSGVTAYGGRYIGSTAFSTAGTSVFLFGCIAVACLNAYAITAGTPRVVLIGTSSGNTPTLGAATLAIAQQQGYWGDSGPLLATSIGTTSAYAPDNTLYKTHRLTGTAAGITVTINAPNTAARGQAISFFLLNSSGGAVTWTFNASYRVATVNPATGTGIGLVFTYDGSQWLELGRSAAA